MEFDTAGMPPDVAVRFVCPACRGKLVDDGGDERCEVCNTTFPRRDGIRHYFIDPGKSDDSDLKSYTENFLSLGTAKSYARSFEAIPRKRWRTRRELAVLERLMVGDPDDTVLNIPCGSGRLSAPLRAHTRVLIEADSSPGQLALNQRRVGDDAGVVLITASAFQLPLPDRSMDTVVCARLSHHLTAALDRERLFAELMRVARRRVVFSFRNRASLQSLSRRLRGRTVHPSAMSAGEVEKLASLHGGRLKRVYSVSNFGARHSYALILTSP